MKKFLAIMLALCMAVGIMGCGSKNEDTAAVVSSQKVKNSDKEEPESTEERRTTEADESVSASESDETETDITTGVSEPSEDEADDVPGEIDCSGIILCAEVSEYYILFAVNPETGKCSEVNRFPKFLQEGMFQLTNYYANGMSTFSKDLDKAAFSGCDSETGQYYTGWIDSNGNIFNLTKSLGMDRVENTGNEFEKQPELADYYPLGFTKDGISFVFRESTGEHTEPKYYYVSLDDLTVVHEGNPLKDEINRDSLPLEVGISVTAQLDETEWLYEYGWNLCIWVSGDSILMDRVLVSGEARSNKDGVVGPDGRIAFYSEPRGTAEKYKDTGIYVIQRDGSDVHRIFTIGDLEKLDEGYYDGMYISNFYLLRWE